MSIEDLGNLGEFIASIAVLVSLAYLAVQVRLNTSQLRANEKALLRSENNEVMQGYSALRGHVMTDPSLASILVRARSDYASLEPEEVERLDAHTSEILWINYHLWSRVRDGIFEPERWERVRPVVVQLVQAPGGRGLWTRTQFLFDRAFVEDIEREFGVDR
jgi:hypothetical protein